MHSRSVWTVIALVLLCVFVLESNGSVKCKKHEVPTICGAACQKTCEHPYPETCINVCKEGCVCIYGYVRDKNNKCIPFEKCPKPKYSLE